MPPLPELLVVHRGPRGNAHVAEIAAANGLAIAAYVDDAAGRGAAFDGVPVVCFAEWRERLRAQRNVVSALEPGARRTIAERVAAEGGVFATIGRTGGAVSHTVTFGEGTLVESGPLSIGRASAFGRHVVLLTPASFGHDCIIGDFVTIHPSAAISGHVVVDDCAVIGAGAVIVNGSTARPLRIGAGALIAPGAVVTKSVRPHTTVAGNPARALRPLVGTHE